MESLVGKLLLASPDLEDPNFFHTVLLMIRHDEEGAMGLVLNRPTDTPVSEVWSRVSDAPCITEGPLFHGGPCEGPLMVLHSHAAYSDMLVEEGIYIATEEESVRWLMENEERPIRAFVGYAGWCGGQLEREVEAGGWLAVQWDLSQLLEKVPDWSELMQRMAGPGIDIRIRPDDPSLN